MNNFNLPVLKNFDPEDIIGFVIPEDGILKAKLKKTIPAHLFENMGFNFGFRPIVRDGEIFEIEIYVISLGGVN